MQRTIDWLLSAERRYRPNWEWWLYLMKQYWRWRSGWPGCCQNKQGQCQACPMRALEL